MDPVPPATPDPELRHALETLNLRPSERTAPQITKLAALLRGYEGFLHSLSQADCEIVCRWLEHEFVAPGAPVYNEGSFGEAMYIVFSGTCDVSPPKDSATPVSKSVLHRGEAFGHLALIHPRAPRTRTVIAAAASSGGAAGGYHGGGVHLAVLPRSTINHMRFVGAAQSEVARALQAVLCACCVSVLRVPPGARSSEEVELLAAFLQQLEAFRQLPANLVSRLAADCSHVRLPANTLLFEEDGAGNAMYVVASGQCAVRARPLSQRASSRSASRKLQQQQSHKSVRGQGPYGPASSVNVGRSQRPSYSGVGGTGVGAGGSAGAESMAGVTTLVRFRVRHERTTPAGAVGEGEGGEQQEAEQQQQQQQGAAANAKDSPFWIARFMADAMKRLGGPPPAGGADGPAGQAGHGPTVHRGAGLGQDGGVTPLAAVAAARWRQTALGSRRQRLSEVVEEGPGGGAEGGEGAGVEEEGSGEGEVVQAAAEGAEGAMEALLGRAAARALRRAATESRAWEQEQQQQQQQEEEEQREGAAGEGQPEAAGGDSGSGSGGEDAGGARVTSAAVPGAVAAPPMRSSYWGAASTVTGVTGSGVAGGMGTAVEDPAKRLLLQLGNKDPANASRALLAELVQRADVSVVLYEVAKRLMRNGGSGPQRVTRKASRKIADALNRQIRTGTDRMDTVSGHRVLGRSASVHDRTAMAGPYGGLPRRESQSSGVGLGPTGDEAASYYGGVRASPDGLRPPSAQTGSYGAASVWGGLTFGSDGEGSDGYDDEDGSASFDMDDFAGSELSYGMVSYAHSAASHRRRAMYDLPELAHVRGLGAATPSELDAAFGPTLRTVAPGQSFGELALLHRHSRRTASVIALGAGARGLEEQCGQQHGVGSGAGRRSAAWRAASSFGAADPRSNAAAATAVAATPCLSAEPSAASVAPSVRHSTSLAPSSWVDLIVVPRQVYNRTVRGLQRSQLQGLLGFLAGLPPFAGMDERQLAALAVFCRTREAAAGEVLAARGQPQEELWMVQEGEVVLLDDSASVTQPLGPGAGLPPPARSAPGPGWRALQRALSSPEDSPGLLQRLAAQPGPRPATLQRNGRSLGRHVSVAAVRDARYGSGSGVQQEGGAGRRVAFEGRVGQGEGEAGSKGGPGEVGMRHVAPGVLKGATISSMGPGGMFGEGVLKRVVGEVQQRELMQAVQQQSGGRRGGAGGGGEGQVLGRTVPSAPFPCTVVARRPCKLLVLSAADLCRFAHEVLEPLSRLAAARGELLVQRSSSVAAAQEAVSERVEAGRKLLSDVRTQLARGLPVASNPKLNRALQEELQQAVEANTQEQQLLQQQEGERAQAGQDGQQQQGGQGQGQGQVGLVSKAGLKSEAARRGGRERPRLQLPGVGVVVDRSVRSLVLGGDGPRVAREPHPICTRLDGVLQQGSPVLPPPVVVAKVPTPTSTRPASGAGAGAAADGGQGHMLTQWWGQQGEQEEGQDLEGEAVGAVGPGGAPGHSLSTIVEESSATLRVHVGAGAAGGVGVGGQGEEEGVPAGDNEGQEQLGPVAGAEESEESLLGRCRGSRGSSVAASTEEEQQEGVEEARGVMGRGGGAGGTEGQLEALGRAVADVQQLVGQVQQAVANTHPPTSRTPSRVPSMERHSPSTMMPSALPTNVSMAPLVVPASPVSPSQPTSASGRQLPPLSSRPPSFVARDTSASSLGSGAPTPTGLSYTSQGTPPYGSAHTSSSGGLLPPLPTGGPPSLRRTNSDSVRRRASSGYRPAPPPRQKGSSVDGGAAPPPQLYPIPSLDSASQASLHSYPSLGPTASVAAADLPSAGHSTASIGTNPSRPASGAAAGAVPPYGSSSPVGTAALAAEGGSLSGASVYTDDDGAPSPELSRVPREMQLARSPSAMAANHPNHPNHPTNAPLLPSLLPHPRPAGRIHRSSSGSGTGPRGPSPGVSAAGTSPDADAAHAPAGPWQLGSPPARQSRSPTAVSYGEEAVLMEAMGASLERVSGGRPVRMRSRSGGFSNDGSWPVVLVGSQAQRASVTGGAREVVHGSLWGQVEQAGETVWHDGEKAGQEGSLEQQEEGEGGVGPRLVLPSLVLPRLVDDGGGVVPEACSPRAAALMEGRRGVFGVHGGVGFDSPVHSPRLVSTVY